MNLRAAYAVLRPKAGSAIAVVPLVVFRGAAGGLPIAIGLYIANRWGLHELGAYTVANAFVAVAVVITDWGCSRSLPREIAVAEPHQAARFVAEANGARVLLVAAVFASAALTTLVRAVDTDVSRYLFLLLPLCALATVSTNAVSARVVSREVHGITTAVIVGALVFLALAAVGVRVGGGGLVLSYLIGKLVEAALLVRGRGWVLDLAFRGSVRMLALLWPFSIQAILGVVYSRLSIFTIGHFGSRSDVGLVSAGSAIQNVLLLLPTSMALLVYPPLSVAARDGDGRRMREIIYGYLSVCLTGMLAGIVLLMVSVHRVCSALQIPWKDAAFIVTFVAAGITTIGTALTGVALQALGGERLAARLSFVTLGLAAVYYVPTVARFGAWGVIIGMLAADVTSLLIFGRATLRLGESRWSKVTPAAER